MGKKFKFFFGVKEYIWIAFPRYIKAFNQNKNNKTILKKKNSKKKKKHSIIRMFRLHNLFLVLASFFSFSSEADQCAGEAKSVVIDHKDLEFEINLNGFESWEIIYSDNATQAVLE